MLDGWDNEVILQLKRDILSGKFTFKELANIYGISIDEVNDVCDELYIENKG